MEIGWVFFWLIIVVALYVWITQTDSGKGTMDKVFKNKNKNQ